MEARHHVACMVAILTCFPIASAEAVDLDVRHAEGVQLAGSFEALLPGGSGRVISPDATHTIELGHVTGTLVVWTVESRRAYLAGHHVIGPAERLVEERFDLADAALTLRAAHEMVALRLLTLEDGALRVHAPVDDPGSPVWLDRAYDQATGEPPPLIPQPERVDWHWDAGWPFLGNYSAPDRLAGYPRLPPTATLSILGPAAVQLEGGNLTFVDANGTVHERRLGNWSLSSEVGVPDAHAAPEQRTFVIVNATFGGARIPLDAEWGVSAPALTWMLNGTVTWTGASGSGTIGGEPASFRDETLALVGEIAIAPRRDGALGASAYRATGDAEIVSLAGTIIASDADTTATMRLTAAAITFAALAAIGAWWSAALGDLAARLALPFYTRLSRRDVLDHPTRATIHARVGERPGIHLRALHRLIGGAWGPFAFHVRMMQKLGVIELRKDGRYTALALPGAAQTAPRARSEVAQRILDELAAVGPMTREQLRARLGISRQLLRYHLDALSDQSLIDEREGTVAMTQATAPLDTS